MACANGHFDIVKILLSHPKCEINSQNNSGNTPLRILILFLNRLG